MAEHITLETFMKEYCIQKETIPDEFSAAVFLQLFNILQILHKYCHFVVHNFSASNILIDISDTRDKTGFPRLRLLNFEYSASYETKPSQQESSKDIESFCKTMTALLNGRESTLADSEVPYYRNLPTQERAEDSRLQNR